MSRWHGLLLVLYCAALTSPQGSIAASRLKLNSEFRYVDLLISVDEAYFRSATDVERLKVFLSSLSAYLAAATEPVGRRLSIAQVRVLVPKSRVAMLRQNGYSLIPATWESAAGADILADSRIGGKGTVLHGGTCGESGLRIIMPSYLMRPGNVGYTLLGRLFAQYRWGVLPETGFGGQKFYLYAERFRPMMCSEAIPGVYEVTPGGKKSYTINACIREVSGVLTLVDTCTFIPDSTTSTGAFASLMSDYAGHAHVNRFCDSVSDPAMRHNRYAPTLHAKMCGTLATAEVARKHPDFAAGAGVSSADTVPELVLVEPPASRKIVLMLDISGSMVGNRIRSLITAATRYVTYFVEPGAEVAVASFNGSVEILQPLHPLNSLADRELLSNKIRGLKAQGWTDIAEATIVAMQMLGARAPYNESQSGWVVLITDGEHNNGNVTVEAAISYASLTSIVFDTICMSNESDKRLTQLSNKTSGWALFSSDNSRGQVSTELDSAFAKLADRALGPNRTLLLSASIFSLPMEPVSLTVDESVTASLNFMLSIPGVDLATLNVTAKDPNGVVYGSFLGAEYYETNAALGSVVIKIPDLNIVVGTWTVYVASVNSAGRRRRDTQSSGSSAVAGSLVITGATSDDSVRMTAWLRHYSIAEVTAATVQLVYARIVNATDNGSAVAGASVQAQVTTSFGDILSVTMKDDGLGFDVEAGDNIYTGAVTADQLTSAGDYSVTVSLLTPIHRVTSADKFFVLKRPDGGGTAALQPPPGRIVDLKVEMLVMRRLLRVAFTAPGDRACTGTAASYELRASKKPSELQTAFNSTYLIAQLPGQPAGAQIQANLSSNQFPELFGNLTFYLSAAAVSSRNVSGEPALPVGAMFDYPNDFNKPPDTTAPPVATKKPKPSETSAASMVQQLATAMCLLLPTLRFVL